MDKSFGFDFDGSPIVRFTIDLTNEEDLDAQIAAMFADEDFPDDLSE
jgi:hypothetical protein